MSTNLACCANTCIGAMQSDVPPMQPTISPRSFAFAAAASSSPCVRPPHGCTVGLVLVDEVGVGGGVLDSLAERAQLNVLGFNSSTAATDRARFLNARAEAHWTLRRLLEDGGIALPEDDLLQEELGKVRWFVSPAGLIQIEAKDDLKSRLAGRSPDRLDAAAMAFSVKVVEPFEEVLDGFWW